MITGNMQQLEVEKEWIPEKIYEILQKVEGMNLISLKPGRYELGNKHYMLVDETKTEPRDVRRFEAHHDFADIQIVLSGHEIIEWAPLLVMENMCEALPQNDAYFYEYGGRVISMPMTPGTYSVLYPGDAHKTLVAEGEPENVKKVIVKVCLKSLQ